VNIIEAIKSGKRFKRKGGTSWYSSMSDIYPTINISAISREDFFADDWEVEEVSCYAGSAMITREQFDAAWDKALLMIGIKRHRDALAKELGL
jgi:hypothetical protein